jgi:signal transduction histidine kinase/CheY-like chemotaxis protein
VNGHTKNILYASAILLVLAVCFLTGGSQSPFRFVFFPLIVLLSGRISLNSLNNAGFTFSILFVLMVYVDHPANRGVTDLLAEALSFFLVTIAAGFIVRDLEAEKKRAENAVATYHGLSDDLRHRTSNLQTTLDTLSLVNLQLQKADQDKSRFLANVSHELRTPLSSIRAYSEILLTYDDIDSDTRHEFIHTINAESERMSVMVNENLDLLRIETGNYEITVRQFNPAELIKESAKVVMPMAQGKGLSFEFDIPSNPPLVKGDENQLNQVLVNLFNNAIKFTTEGRITAGVRHKKGYAEFFVEDTGEGIFPEEKEVIFDEFYRISGQLPDRPRGSGLGLSIARKIVEFHGGRIWVESSPGKGSTFFFTIPAANGETLPASPETDRNISEVAWQYGPVLVLYKSIAIRQSLIKLLESLGFKTIGADTPKRGHEMAATIRPGLIISDIIEKCDDFTRLRNWAHGAGVEMMLAVLSIKPNSGDLCVGANGYLARPLDSLQLVSLMEHFFKNRGRFFIISPEKDDARKLQVMLGAEGYGSSLFMDVNEAVLAGLGKVPNGIIIGSFPRPRLEDVVSSLIGEGHFKSLPLFLLVDEDCLKHVTAVTFEAASRQKGGEGVSSLIMAVEKSYAKKWESAAGGGMRYG